MQLGSESLASSLVGTRGELRWSCLVCRHARDSQGSQDAGGRASSTEGNVHRVGISHSEAMVEFVCREWEFVVLKRKINTEREKKKR